MSAAAEARGEEAARWLRYAREDLVAAQDAGHDAALAPRHRCMLAQQAAEKALKAALIVLDVDPPRTHNLQLLADLLPADWSVHAASADLARLSLWIVESRYPGDWPDASKSDADIAASDAAVVVDAVAADIEHDLEAR